MAVWRRFRWRRSVRYRRRCAPEANEPEPPSHPRRKPTWVTEEVVRIASRTPASLCSCRTISHRFNARHHSHGVSIGKDFAHGILTKQAARIGRQRSAWRKRAPVELAANEVWGLDLTFIASPDDPKRVRPVLAIIDHGSRRLLQLRVLNNKSACTIARGVIAAVECFGTPRALRTDNESMFRSGVYLWLLRWLGIRPQRSEVRCPWQNGRVERFFGTLKREMPAVVPAHWPLELQLQAFRRYYNEQRPHQSLRGRTPMQAWRADRTDSISYRDTG